MHQPSNGTESRRRRVLAALEILDTAPEREFEALVRAARRIFGCKTAYVSLIDVDRQWFKARQGFEPESVSRDCSICAIAVQDNRTIIVPNLQDDPVYGEIPEIKAAPELQFFASIPLLGPEHEGHRVPIGTLCVIDDTPHVASREQIDELEDLAHLVEALFETRLSARLSAKALQERKAMVEDMARTQRQFEMAEQMAQIGHWRLDLATGEIFWSKETCAIHAVESASEEVLEHALEYYLPHDRPRISQAVDQCMQNGVPYDLELDFRDANGVLKRVRAIGEIEYVDGVAVAMIGVFQDITERHLLEQRLRRAAHQDDLTGLANRARLNQYLDERLIAASEAGQSLALLLIDLDHFKAANDLFGHELGDQILQDVAMELLQHPFDSHFAARLGGDEFVLIIEGGPLLSDLAGTLDRLLKDLRFEVGEDDQRINVTATIGAARLTDETAERSALLRAADHALYHAKRRERGTAAIYSEVIAEGPEREGWNLRATG